MVGDSAFMVWGAARTGSMPKGLALSPDGKRLYASNIGRVHRKNIAVYDADPLTFVRFVDYEGSSIEIFPSRDGKWLFSTNMYRYGHFDVLDTETLSLQHHIRITGFPKMILPNAAGDTIYLSMWNGNGVAKLTWPGLQITKLETPGRSRYSDKHYSKQPRGMALSADEKTLYVVNNNDRSMSFIDTDTFQERKRRNIGSAPRHIAQSPDKKTLYLSLTGNDAIAVFDTESEKVTRRIRVGHRPKGVEVAHDGRFLYAANYGGSSLTIVDLQTDKQAKLKLNVLKVSGLVVHPNDNFIYITGWCTNDVWAIQRIDPGEEPLPLGTAKRNYPCYDCPSPFTGCPSRKSRAQKDPPATE
jgi:YVTN family beta-propeller protein